MTGRPPASRRRRSRSTWPGAPRRAPTSLRRGDRVRGEQPRGDLRALGGEVGGEAAQVTEAVGVPGGHVGAAAVPGVDEAVVGEQLEGLPQGHDADAELAGQLALGGQRTAGGPPAAGDPVPQGAVDAQVLGLPVVSRPPGRAHGRAWSSAVRRAATSRPMLGAAGAVQHAAHQRGGDDDAVGVPGRGRGPAGGVDAEADQHRPGAVAAGAGGDRPAGSRRRSRAGFLWWP